MKTKDEIRNKIAELTGVKNYLLARPTSARITKGGVWLRELEGELSALNWVLEGK